MKALVLEELLDKVKNRFLLVTAAAKRARQIKDGSKVLVDAPEDESPVIVALDEILEDKIAIDFEKEVEEETGEKVIEPKAKAEPKAEKEEKAKEKKTAAKKDDKKKVEKKKKTSSKKKKISSAVA
jgi:DNA-directed RNA polymerase subunit omega